MNLTTETTATSRRGVSFWVQILIWAFLAVFLVLMGIGVTRAQQGTVQPGYVVPDFSLTLFSGYEYNSQSEIKISDLRGKVLLINFWASWCKPCEQEAAELEAAWKEYEPTGQVVFLGVDYVDTPEHAFIYLKKFGITYPNGEDLNVTLKRPISQYFRIKGVPETYFVDQDGVLQYVQVGPFTSIDQIRAQIDPLLGP